MTDNHNPKSRELDGDGLSEMSSAMQKLAGRRQFLTGAATVVGGISVLNSSDVWAMADKNEPVHEPEVHHSLSEHVRPKKLDPASYDLPRFMPEKTGNFDLTQPLDNHYAWVKTAHNLGGKIDWYAQYGWVMFCPPGQPSYPFLGKIQLGQSHITYAQEHPDLVPDPSPHDALAWSSFVQVYCDPRTLKIVDEMRNPYTGEMMDLSPKFYADRLATRFGKSVLVPGVDPKFYEQPWDREGGFSQHFYDAGDDITYTVLGSAQKPSEDLQPRVDVAFWSVAREDLMNPDMRSIDCRRNYAVIQKAAELPWSTVPVGDMSQVLGHSQGYRTSNTSLLPAPCRKLLDNFPDRFRIED